MSRLSWFAAGAFSLIAVLFIGATVFLRRVDGFSAKTAPSTSEKWLAQRMRSMAVTADTKGRVNPVSDSPEVLEQAKAHWADHCAGCHANNGSGRTEMGQHMYPPSPDMREPETQNLTDGELFFIIENGIRLTGMPGWGGRDRDPRDSWKLVRFIRHLPHLTAAEERTMEKMNPRSPDEIKEEQEEKEFLNGGQAHAHTH
jgi:mono/diheme cytochrome c family protein